MTRAEYESYEQRVKEFFEGEGINCLSPVSDRADGEYEAFFSNYRCDLCGALPGNRYSCAGFNPTMGKVQGGYEVCEGCLYYVTYGRLDDLTMLGIEEEKEMSDLKLTLMKRDNLTSDEADELIEEMRKAVEGGADPEELLFDEGLEPDYLDDLLEGL